MADAVDSDFLLAGATEHLHRRVLYGKRDYMKLLFDEQQPQTPIN